MTDADDYPRCSTCDHWRQLENPFTGQGRDSGVCHRVRRGLEPATTLTEEQDGGMKARRDFGCVLHSSLQSEDDT